MPHVAISVYTKMASKQTSSDQFVRQRPRNFATENPFGRKCKGRVEQLHQAREQRQFSATSQPVVASTDNDLAATSSKLQETKFYLCASVRKRWDIKPWPCLGIINEI